MTDCDFTVLQLYYFQDEGAGDEIQEFCGLRAKMYSLSMHNGGHKKTCKGITRVFQKKRLLHEDYVRALNKNKIAVTHQLRIRAIKHQLYTVVEKKRGLNAFNDKRFFVSPDLSLAFGHWKIKENIVC